MKWHAFNSKHMHRKFKSCWLNPYIKDFYSCLHILILLATKQLQMERCRICTARLAESGLVVGGRSERQPFSEPHSIERQVSRALTLPAQPRLKNHHHHHHQNHANHHCYHHLGSLGYFVVVLEFWTGTGSWRMRQYGPVVWIITWIVVSWMNCQKWLLLLFRG